MPKTDGNCPSCHKDTNEANKEMENLTSAVFTPAQQLPECCMTCGANTGGKTYTYRQTIPGEKEPNAAVSLIGILFGRLFKRLLKQSLESVAFKLPVCGSCKSFFSRLKPVRYDRDSEKITFVVHKDFKDKLQKING
ncbi:MAG: hypothetical protein GY765_36380 [bacterium]|nr:hypothetical protein [bacterium]